MVVLLSVHSPAGTESHPLGAIVSETNGSEAAALASDALPAELNSRADASGESQDESARSASAGPVDAELEVPLEVDVEEIPAPAPSGFQAFLQHASLHNLLQIESLSRTTGVFLVASQGRKGYLHLANGELVHAETGGTSGEAAASEILSWEDGEFKSSSEALAATPTIYSSLQALLLRLARDSDESSYSVRRAASAPAVQRPFEEDKPTEPHLPAPVPEAGLRPPSSPPPRSGRLPPPLPPRIDRESGSVAEVLISASGEILQGRGAAPDEFSARVAYAARLADLIGRAIRSGTPRALELRGKSTQTLIKWQTDGTLSATLELAQSSKR
jgi:hypothetical protein